MTQTIPWTFEKNRAVLLVVDMQNDFVNEGAPMEVPMARKYIPNMRRLVEASRENGIPVIFTKHVHFAHYEVTPLEMAYASPLSKGALIDGTPGVEVIDELKPLPGETVLPKHRYDAFHNTHLETIIRNIRGLGVADTVVVTGTVTNICCESTARSAFMRDFKVVFVGDANGGKDEASQQATLAIMGDKFGRVMSTEELVREIEAH